ncbi:MAG: S1/P1 nuclease [Roseateles sp.]|uniref:S1/P1 nuclease n=1 Tax=Roseateles sp. TaxID=1971397 RepID=UPI0039EAD00A
MPVSRFPVFRHLAAAAAAALALVPVACQAWGQEGHAIVAEIAQRRLTPAAAAGVAQLQGGASLASVASWADDVRGQRPGDFNLHFVNLPRGARAYDAQAHCAPSAKGDCVVAALGRAQQALRCGPTEEARREALRYVVHFVGDLHQPLHATGDLEGGNGFKVHGSLHGQTCKGACALESGNLHSLWDAGLIRRAVWAWGAYVDRLEQTLLATQDFDLKSGGDQPADWALQSHAVGELVWNDQLIPADGRIDDAYYAAVLPVLDQQLALGGLRLARLLNETFAPGSCSAPVAGTPWPAAETGLRPAANLGELKAQFSAYRDGGGYARDQAAVAEAATAYVLARAGQVARPALVLDIDETSLDNWGQMAQNDFGYIVHGDCGSAPGTACGALAWEAQGRAPAIAATLKLYRAARAAGVAVFFITGRKEAERAGTEANLRAAGYDGWAGVVLRPDGAHGAHSAASFKAAERARIVMQGYQILATVGDQPSDLSGGYAEKAFLLPNPFYRIP